MTLNLEKIPVPSQRLGDVSSILQDMAITTFDVDPQKLQSLIPDAFTPDIVTLQNGKPRALISAVTFFNHNFLWSLLLSLRSNVTKPITEPTYNIKESKSLGFLLRVLVPNGMLFQGMYGRCLSIMPIILIKPLGQPHTVPIMNGMARESMD